MPALAPPGKRTEEEARAQSRLRRQERKRLQQHAFKTGVWDKCLYRVPGKQRFCAQQRSSHSEEYCATHMGASPSLDKGKRVPCPVDPNHTVYEQHLSAHVKVCNLTALEAQTEQLPYYHRGINSGSFPGEAEGGGAGGCGSGGEDVENGLRRSEHEATRRIVSWCLPLLAQATAAKEEVVLEIIARIDAAYSVHVGGIRTEVLDPPEVQAIHRARLEGGTGFRKGRHVLQQASIVGHMVKRGLAGECVSMQYVEMGAGMGALGHAIATAFPGADITMVERSAVRRKAENRLDGSSSASRVRIDIRDLNMARLPSLDAEDHGRPVVAIAKHLCGAATDLALRAMRTLPSAPETPAKRHESTNSATTAAREDARDTSATATATPADGMQYVIGSRVGGIAVATCCHHACNWGDYAGRDFLSSLGFTARDFEVMRRISAWISLEPAAGTRKNNSYPDEGCSSGSMPRTMAIPPSDAGSRKRPVPHGLSGPRSSTADGSCSDSTSASGKNLDHEITATDGRDPAKLEVGNTAGARSDEALHEIQQSSAGVDGGDIVDQSSGASRENDHVHHNMEFAAGADGPGAFNALGPAEKARAARVCKRLLDRGRQEFLRESLGLRTEMVHFVEPNITPENALLLGFP